MQAAAVLAYAALIVMLNIEVLQEDSQVTSAASTESVAEMAATSCSRLRGGTHEGSHIAPLTPSGCMRSRRPMNDVPSLSARNPTMMRSQEAS
jgi:hypothetical protein